MRVILHRRGMPALMFRKPRTLTPTGVAALEMLIYDTTAASIMQVAICHIIQNYCRITIHIGQSNKKG